MANIISIATATPAHCHNQQDILTFMQEVYRQGNDEKRKLDFLYKHSAIAQRYSVIKDFGLPRSDWQFIPQEHEAPFPLLEQRMQLFQQEALPLALQAINICLEGKIDAQDVTHVITVSCTGMSAPGLDLQIAEALQLPGTIFRTSINFMGCYAAVHALKLAHLICKATPAANVLVVCVELCTLHLQKEFTPDNAASSLLFADGCAAVLISEKQTTQKYIRLNNFYSQIAANGKQDMAWEMSSKGFLMTLSGYIPQLIKEDIIPLVDNALKNSGWEQAQIDYWCIHPGGKKILDVIALQLKLKECDLAYSRKILSQYGNMSSATILFVLKDMMEDNTQNAGNVFGAAFGPGLTMETFTAIKVNCE